MHDTIRAIPGEIEMGLTEVVDDGFVLTRQRDIPE
jgi:hypothetical protein